MLLIHLWWSCFTWVNFCKRHVVPDKWERDQLCFLFSRKWILLRIFHFFSNSTICTVSTTLHLRSRMVRTQVWQKAKSYLPFFAIYFCAMDWVWHLNSWRAVWLNHAISSWRDVRSLVPDAQRVQRVRTQHCEHCTCLVQVVVRRYNNEFRNFHYRPLMTLLCFNQQTLCYARLFKNSKNL